MSHLPTGFLFPLLAVVLAPPFCGRLYSGEAQEGDGASLAQDEIKALIEARVDAEAGKRMDRRKIAGELGLPWPVVPTQKSAKKVIETALATIGAMVSKQFPGAPTEEYRREAAEKYAPHELGEHVTFVVRGGLGVYTLVSGRLREVTSERVLVGDRWIVISDMDRGDLARFYPAIFEQVVAKHVRTQTLRYNFRREDYEEKLRKTVMPEYLARAGYIPKDQKKTISLNPEDWQDANAILEHRCSAVLAAQKATLRRTVEREVYTEHGYEYVESTKTWRPKETKQTLGGRLKRIFGR